MSRILIVEDEEIIRNALKKVLETFPATVASFNRPDLLRSSLAQ